MHSISFAQSYVLIMYLLFLPKTVKPLFNYKRDIPIFAKKRYLPKKITERDIQNYTVV